MKSDLRGVALEAAAGHVERVGRPFNVERPADAGAKGCRDAERRCRRVACERDLQWNAAQQSMASVSV